MNIINGNGKQMKKRGRPNKNKINNKLKLILQGKLSREEVVDWASEYVMQDESNISERNRLGTPSSCFWIQFTRQS